MGKAILSILIATVENRRDKFEKLHQHLLGQKTEDVEIIYLRDNKQISVGEKRQRLLNMSSGEYVVFIDDDDWVPDFYVDKILNAVKSNPDCIGFRIDCDMDGISKTAVASKKYKIWSDNIDGFNYVRSIYHKTPVKREIAIKVGFPNKRFGEDADYSRGVMKLVKTEVFIDDVMYFYRYRPEPNKYG